MAALTCSLFLDCWAMSAVPHRSWMKLMSDFMLIGGASEDQENRYHQYYQVEQYSAVEVPVPSRRGCHILAWDWWGLCSERDFWEAFSCYNNHFTYNISRFVFSQQSQKLWSRFRVWMRNLPFLVNWKLNFILPTLYWARATDPQPDWWQRQDHQNNCKCWEHPEVGRHCEVFSI